MKLCPHKNFDDTWMVEVLYRMSHPDDILADPLDQWEADAKYAIDASGTCSRYTLLTLFQLVSNER